MGRLFSLITGILGLVADIIGIGVFFFTAPPPPQSSSYAVEDAVIGFVLFYGWIALSSALIRGAMQKEPWRSKVKQGWNLFGGSTKFDLAFQSSLSIGFLIWPIMIAFIAMIGLQTKQNAQQMIVECFVGPIFVILGVGMILALVQETFMSMFIGD